jgi:hypothetical protein
MVTAAELDAQVWQEHQRTTYSLSFTGGNFT